MSVKHLGVVLDSRLTWKEHVDVKVRNAHNLLWACRTACGVMWGLSTKVVHWFYVSIIRPYVIFETLVWWPGCQTAGAKKRLSRIPKIGILRDNGSDAHYPTSTMEALTCLPSLELLDQSEARLAALRL